MKDNRYYNNEIDFCRARGTEARSALEKIFLRSRVSYFIRFENRTLLGKLFQGKKPESCIFRINARDFARASELVSGMENVTVIGKPPEEEWSPQKAALERETSTARRHASQAVTPPDELYEENGEGIEEPEGTAGRETGGNGEEDPENPADRENGEYDEEAYGGYYE